MLIQTLTPVLRIVRARDRHCILLEAVDPGTGERLSVLLGVGATDYQAREQAAAFLKLTERGVWTVDMAPIPATAQDSARPIMPPNRRITEGRNEEPDLPATVPDPPLTFWERNRARLNRLRIRL